MAQKGEFFSGLSSVFKTCFSMTQTIFNYVAENLPIGYLPKSGEIRASSSIELTFINAKMCMLVTKQ